MSKEIMSISDDTFTLTETETPGVLHFYRNDGNIIGQVDNSILYHIYICIKMMSGQIKGEGNNDAIYYEISDDGKYIELIISKIKKSKIKKRRSNLIKRLFNKIFK